MKKEFNGVGGICGYKCIVDTDKDTLFIKSSICKEECFLPHLEWIKLGKINSQGRGILNLLTDAQAEMNIVFKKDQLSEMKELFEILFPYVQRMLFNYENQKLTVYNKGNCDSIEKPINKINISIPRTFLSFDDIESYEIICDKYSFTDDELRKNTIITKGTLTKLISSLKNTEYITNLQIKLNLKSTDKPFVFVNYITRKTESNGEMAKDLIRMCDEDLVKLESILQKDHAPVTTPKDKIHETVTPPKTNIDPFEEVKKLKELLDMGILTQEEFDKKKKELLNL